MVATEIAELDAVALRDALASGQVSARAVAEHFIARTEAQEDTVRAFAWFDADHVRRQADACDTRRAEGQPTGRLHGMPVGLKDVIDTAGIPTENGTVIDSGRVPAADAALVTRLKAEGAVIMGKTVSTELAFLHPAITANPAAPGHTPGGSSAGSAAAVAAGMLPLAVGTQTGGSVIRPAAFCGISGFKPSFGQIPRDGVLMQSPSLDTLGVFADTPAGAAMLAECLFAGDAPAALLATASAAPPSPPRFVLAEPPGWADADPRMHSAMADLAARLGDTARWQALPSQFASAPSMRETINSAEMAHCFAAYRAKGWDRLSPEMQAAITAGDAVPAPAYIAALEHRAGLAACLDAVLADADALLTPATLGPPPQGLGSTGNSIFNGIWTLSGTPAVTIPVFQTEDGLPMGLQLTAARGDDARLLRTAAWLMAHLGRSGVAD